MAEGYSSVRVEEGRHEEKELTKQEQLEKQLDNCLPGNPKSIHNAREGSVSTNETEWIPRCPHSEAELKELLQEIDGQERLPVKARPKAPRLTPGMSMRRKLQGIQQFICSFEYNHTRENYFEVRKDLGMKRIVSTAKEIIREALPIKCIEAVFLGCYLTNEFMDVTRIPVRFQSRVAAGHIYRHIILAVEYKGTWGALGLSRKDTLMYKELKHHSLAALIADFQSAYEECGHILESLSVGLPFGRDLYSAQPIHWRALTLDLLSIDEDQTKALLNKFWGKIGIAEKHVMLHGRIHPETLLQEKFNGRTNYTGTVEASLGSPKAPMKQPSTPQTWEQKRSPCHPSVAMKPLDNGVKVVTLDGIETIYPAPSSLSARVDPEKTSRPTLRHGGAKAKKEGGSGPSLQREANAV